MTHVHLHINGKPKKRDRLHTELSVSVDQAVALARAAFAAHEFHITGECDLKSVFKATLDEDISATAMFSMIHIPTSDKVLRKRNDTRTLLFAISVVVTGSGDGDRSRVEVLDPLTRAAREDDSLEAAARKVSKALKATLKRLEKESKTVVAAGAEDGTAA